MQLTITVAVIGAGQVYRDGDWPKGLPCVVAATPAHKWTGYESGATAQVDVPQHSLAECVSPSWPEPGLTLMIGLLRVAVPEHSPRVSSPSVWP